MVLWLGIAELTLIVPELAETSAATLSQVVGEADGRGGIERAEAVFVIHVVTGAVGGPTRVERIVFVGALYEDVLHVAPRQRRVRAEHQRNDARNERRGRRSAAEVVGVIRLAGDAVVTICTESISGRDAYGFIVGVRGDQHARARLAVVRLAAGMIDRAHADHVAAVGVAVVVGVVVGFQAVARGPGVDASPTLRGRVRVAAAMAACVSGPGASSVKPSSLGPQLLE